MSDQITEALSRRVQQILPNKESLEEKLRSGQKIKLYQGFDPSSPNLHIGHLVGLLQLKMFQDLGHEVIFLIGDFTGMIGDPSDRSSTRPVLTHDQVMENAKTYQAQAGHILRFEGDNPAKILFNSEWNNQLNFAGVLELAANVTVQQMIERDMFQERIKADKPIHLHEFLYPLIQGYDSVAMDVDLEVGGNDQMFNLMVGRQLMRVMKNKEKFCLTTRLLTDANGAKIGKTTGNAINLFGDPNDLYGAIMSQPDSILESGFDLATTLDLNEVAQLKQQAQSEPMQVKKRLAFEVVKLCHGQEIAEQAQTHFASLFQKQGETASIPEVNIDNHDFTLQTLLDTLNLGESNSDRKRMIRDGAVSINEVKITDSNTTVTPKSGDIIKYGKHTFVKLVVNG